MRFLLLEVHMNTLETIDIIKLQKNPDEQSLNFVQKIFDDYLGQTELKHKLAVYTQSGPNERRAS